MWIYTRLITKREPINRFGKLGFVLYRQIVKTDDIEPFNKGKRIRFEPSMNMREHEKYMDIRKNVVIEEFVDIVSRNARKGNLWKW